MEVLSSSEELRVRTQGVASSGANQSNEIAKAMLVRLLAQGLTLKECSVALHRHMFTIRAWAREDWVREKLRSINDLAFQKIDGELKAKAETTFVRIQEVSDEALNKLLDLMENADSQVVQMRCAQDLLDRNPETSKTRKVEKTERAVHIDATFIQLAQEADRESGVTING